MGINKRKITNENSAIAPLIAILIIAGVTLVAGIGIYQITVKPDVVYNISDTGFSLAGLGIDSTTLLIIGFAVVMLFLFIGGKKKN